MTVQYCSDLHLEFRENKKFLKLNPLIPRGEILLLAGDIVPFAILNKHADFFDYVSDHFEITYWIPGNHEYYHFDLADKYGVIKEAIRSNVFLVNNQSVQYQNVKFVFSTLWSKISPAHQWAIQQNLADFHVIKFNGEPYTPFHANQQHNDSKLFIKEAVNENEASTTFMVTHHVPTFLHYPEKYKGDALNEAFATEMYDFIEQSNIDFWLYGHHHCNTPVFEIGTTRLLTNQLGYVKYKEHMSFQRVAVVDIDTKKSK